MPLCRIISILLLVGGDATSFTKDDLRALFVTEVSYLCKNRF